MNFGRFFFITTCSAAAAAADDRLAALFDGLNAKPAAAGAGGGEKPVDKANEPLKELPLPLGFFLAVAQYHEKSTVDCYSTMQKLQEFSWPSGLASRRKAYISQYLKFVCDPRFPPDFSRLESRIQRAIYKEAFEREFYFGHSQTDLLFQMWKPNRSDWAHFKPTSAGDDALSCLTVMIKYKDKPVAEILGYPAYKCALVDKYSN